MKKVFTIMIYLMFGSSLSFADSITYNNNGTVSQTFDNNSGSITYHGDGTVDQTFDNNSGSITYHGDGGVSQTYDYK